MCIVQQSSDFHTTRVACCLCFCRWNEKNQQQKSNEWKRMEKKNPWENKLQLEIWREQVHALARPSDWIDSVKCHRCTVHCSLTLTQQSAQVSTICVHSPFILAASLASSVAPVDIYWWIFAKQSVCVCVSAMPLMKSRYFRCHTKWNGKISCVSESDKSEFTSQKS